MNELHLVGYTADLRYLVFEDASKASRFRVAVDEDLLETLDEVLELADPDRDRSSLQRRPSERGNGAPEQAAASAEASAAPPSSRRSGSLAALALLGSTTVSRNGDSGEEPEPGPRSSNLSPREIQVLLRSGMSPRAVARQADTDEAWVQRWLAPIEAERRQIVRQVQLARLHKARLGPSRDLLGDAVVRNLSAKGVKPDDPSIEWSASRRDSDEFWTVALRYRSRGHRQRAVWRFSPETGTVEARNKVAADVGWTRGRRPKKAATPAKSAPKKTARKAATNKAAPGAQRQPSRRQSPAAKRARTR